MPDLEYRLHVPATAQPGAPVVVLLHGRGSTESDLLRLAPRLPGAVIVAPRGPFEAARWGYGSGWAWYRHLGGTRPERQGFDESLARLESFLTGLPSLLPVKADAVVLGGFSQGGTVSLGFALTRPGVVQCVIDMSGFLPEHPDVRVTPATVADTRFFWGHGRKDAQVSFAFAEQGRAALMAAGAHLRTADYAMGHRISRGELRDISNWLSEE
ncbi:MAG TPA: alpha/beta hydrolase-fold protein [Longimicrobiales bacterium]|nr:alpha/beta hydrolase-fold protein [Longimicrobiales bacterium]